MKWTYFFTMTIVGLASLALAGQSHALVVIDEVTDSFTVGGFTVTGNNVPSGTGQNYEVLKFRPQGNNSSATASDGSSLDQAPHGDVTIGDLWNHLDANGVTSASRLGFGFDSNQNTDFVDVDALTVTLFNGPNPFRVYTLNDTVRVSDDLNGPGSSTAEARFIVDLDFDFMTTYNAGTTDGFQITATHSSANGGFEEYFLSSVFSDGGAVPPGAAPIPEPATMTLLGAGLLAGMLRRKD
jgi:hypothetical protein